MRSFCLHLLATQQVRCVPGKRMLRPMPLPRRLPRRCLMQSRVGCKARSKFEQHFPRFFRQRLLVEIPASIIFTHRHEQKTQTRTGCCRYLQIRFHQEVWPLHGRDAGVFSGTQCLHWQKRLRKIAFAQNALHARQRVRCGTRQRQRPGSRKVGEPSRQKVGRSFRPDNDRIGRLVQRGIGHDYLLTTFGELAICLFDCRMFGENYISALAKTTIPQVMVGSSDSLKYF